MQVEGVKPALACCCSMFTVYSDWEAPQGSSRLNRVQIGELARGLRRHSVYIPPGAPQQDGRTNRISFKNSLRLFKIGIFQLYYTKQMFVFMLIIDKITKTLALLFTNAWKSRVNRGRRSIPECYSTLRKLNDLQSQ